MRTMAALVTLFVALAVALPAASAADPIQTRADRARATVHYQNGWKLFRSEAWDEAAREFRKAIEFDEQYELAHYGLGRTYMALKRYVEAIQAYRTSRSLFLRSVSDQYTSQQDRRQRLQDQLRQIDELIRETERGRQTAQSQNRVRQLQDQQSRIRQNMDRELGAALDTTVPAFLSLALGSAHFRAEQFAEAEAEYKACLEADPKAGEAWSNLAVIYLVTNRIADAERAVAGAEKAGFAVNPDLKAEIARRKGEGAPVSPRALWR